MGKVHQFKPRKPAKPKRVAFTQEEMRQVFDLYSRRVSMGEWRDYAIGLYEERAVFSVFRHASAQPLYRIEKHGHQGGRFILLSGREKLKSSKSLAEILAAVPKSPRLVVTI